MTIVHDHCLRSLTPLLGGLCASLLSIVEPISSTTEGPGAQPLANLGAYGGVYPRQSSLKESISLKSNATAMNG